MEKLLNLYKALEGNNQLLIIPHNDPDPDAIASSVGLRYLVLEKYGIEAQIYYSGMIGRSENKAFVKYLNYPMKKLDLNVFQNKLPIALVDTQPGIGNNPLPDDISAAIVIDHHPLKAKSLDVIFADVRPEIGATATIVTEYLREAELDLPAILATALFYGIKTDTMGLGRGANLEDAKAYFYLQPKVDDDVLVQIENAQVPSTYFESLTKALNTARVYDRDLVICYIGTMKYPDLGAEIADLFLRLQEVKWVICMGVYKDSLILSTRSRSRLLSAGFLIREIIGDLGVAGGHGTMAGGQIPLHNQNPSQLSDSLSRKAILFIKGDSSLEGRSFV